MLQRSRGKLVPRQAAAMNLHWPVQDAWGSQPEIISLFHATWKCVKWPCISFLQTLPPSQSPRAMKQPQDDKPYSGARHQQCPHLILSGTEMIPGETFSWPLPFSPFQSTQWRILSSFPALLLKQITLCKPRSHHTWQSHRKQGWRKQILSALGVLKEVQRTELFSLSQLWANMQLKH